MFESLESRRLLTVTASFNSGILSVVSDGSSDHVLIGRNDHSQIFVHYNHHVVLAVSAHSVAKILVNLGAGNDSLTTQDVNAPLIVHGGSGNDALSGGAGHDTIFGDEGDDLITAQDGSADTVDGGAGTDTAYVDHADTVTHVEHVIHPHHPHHLPHHSAVTLTVVENLRPLDIETDREVERESTNSAIDNLMR